jgi:hypothetical protein
MKCIAPFSALVLVLGLVSCARDKDEGWKDFAGRFYQAQHDYCSTNMFVAESGMLALREWVSDTNHVTEPAATRGEALFKIDGRLFLLEDYLGNKEQADRYAVESMQAYNHGLDYIISHHLNQRPMKPLTTKEQLRKLLLHQDEDLDVGWMRKDSVTK